ncbi:MAG TPA: ATP-binding protein [Thermoanaerobaculia bacterium]
MISKPFDSAIVGTPQEAVDFITNILQASTEYSIIGKGLDGTILLWNEGARRIYGYEPEEVVGRANSAILHTPGDVAAGRHHDFLQAALRDGNWEGTINRVRKNGERFTARVVITPRHDGTGRPIGYLLISKDVSSEIRLTAALQEKNVQLERASQAKDRFLASMSHELRTPLNAIIGFTGTLLMHLPGPLTGEQEGLRLELELGDEELIALADRRALAQILGHLADNAVKFTDAGHIRLELRQRADQNGGGVEITIADSGPGIDEDTQAQLFSAFAQPGEGAHRHEGSGVGLHLCQRLAALLGGRITLRSTLGEGSAFTLSLPLASAVPAPAGGTAFSGDRHDQ